MDKFMKATTRILGNWKHANNQTRTARLIESIEEQGVSHQEAMYILYEAFAIAMDEQKRRSPVAGF